VSPKTGLTFLGYHSRRPWLWLVDLDAAAVAPTNTSLPGNDVAISELSVRDGWLAVQTHSVLWSVPLGLDAPGRALVESFTFAPSLDGETVWVEPPGGLGVRHRLIAVDGHGIVVKHLELPEGWRLHAETPAGFLVEHYEQGRLGMFVAGAIRVLVEANVMVGVETNGKVVVWADRDDRAALRLTDLRKGQTRTVRHPHVAEWQWFPSFSPDGSLVAIGGYPDPPQPLPELIASRPHTGRRAVMMLVDLVSGECRGVEGEYDNFAWRPAWSADGSWVVFCAPFQPRRLYVFRPDEAVLHTIKFRRSAPAPMLDVTGRLTLPDVAD
jgi:hypothetical protein